MVSVNASYKNPTYPSIADATAWLMSIQALYSEEELSSISRACEYAAVHYAASDMMGIPLLQHALGTAHILTQLRLDHESIVAALLHALPQCLTESDLKTIPEKFTPAVAKLIDGVARMSQIQSATAHTIIPGNLQAKDTHKKQHSQAEAVRKMLLAMVEDIRVVIIKLAERTQFMRTLPQLPREVQLSTAHESLELFSPLANRLGVWQIKWELEDLSFRYLEPDFYKTIVGFLDEKRLDREQYIALVVKQLRTELSKAEITAEVAGRPKHIYSIAKKMRRKELNYENIYDVRAVRILVEKEAHCYAVLGIVHSLWQPISGEFDDYISHPKGNFYRSLHTAVIGPQAKALEIQIRTYAMHKDAELGIAAHWRYKEGGKSDSKFDEKIAWLRQLLEWREDIADTADLVEQFKTDLFQDTIYVLTPQGKVIDLPQDATPLDFAYHVHSDLGHRCRGAKVNGAIVPLTYKLQNGQRVEILTTKLGAPSRDWLSPSLGFLKTARAKAKVRNWFKSQNYDANVTHGRSALEKEAHRVGIALPNLDKLAQDFNYLKPDDFFAALARGEVGHRQLTLALQQLVPQENANLPKPVAPSSGPGQQSKASAVLVNGVSDLALSLAGCCKPLPPDSILAYVTQSRGMTIHRSDCVNIQRIDPQRQERLLAAQWSHDPEARFPVDIGIHADGKETVLRDILEFFSKEHIRTFGMKSHTTDGNIAIRCTIEVNDLTRLNELFQKLRQFPHVVRVYRAK